MYRGLHVWYPLFLSDFRKTLKISHLKKIRPLGAELFHADGQTDVTKLTAAFHNFANMPKKKPHSGQPVCEA